MGETMSDKVIDFCEKRKESVEEKRRRLERVMFQNFLGAYSVLDRQGSIHPIDLVDVSHHGCLFEVPWNVNKDKKMVEGTEITLRMYFTKDSYIPVIVNVKYAKEHLSNDGKVYMRYGCEFDESMPSFDALKSFIEFLYKFAEHSAVDHGDQKVYFL